MDREYLVSFASGIVFHYGVVRRESRIWGLFSLALALNVCHRVLAGMCVLDFIRSAPPLKKPGAFGGISVVLILLFVLEGTIAHTARQLVPQNVWECVERFGGGVLLVAICLILGSLWALNGAEVEKCRHLDRGVYAYCRHPYYLGMCLLFFGGCFTLGITVFPLVSFFVLKERVAEYVQQEEAHMLEVHSKYRDYMRRVKLGILVQAECRGAGSRNGRSRKNPSLENTLTEPLIGSASGSVSVDSEVVTLQKHP